MTEFLPRMKRIGIIGIAIFLAFVAVLATIWMTVSPGRPGGEPYYQGHSLSYWLRVKDRREEVRAIRAMGTNAIPIAIRWMSKGWKSNGYQRFPPEGQIEMGEGEEVLHCMGEEARPAIPALIGLTKHKDNKVRSSALTMLLNDLYPGDAIMRPVLIRLTNDPFPGIRYDAGVALADIDGRLDDWVRAQHAKNPGTAAAGETNTPPASRGQPQPK